MLTIYEIAAWLAPHAKPKTGGFSYASLIRHLGGFGLFLIAILDSSPIPTFGGLDILLAILAARKVEPWYYYAFIATAGSITGAILTYRAAHAAGAGYLEKKFGKRRVKKLVGAFEHWGTGGLAVSTAVPLPFPTSAFFAIAGVLKYRMGKFVSVVAVCRALRYSLIAWTASRYGRHFVRTLSHPKEYVGWFVAIIVGVVIVIVTFVILRRAQHSSIQLQSPQ